jgi:hypothetical protein
MKKLVVVYTLIPIIASPVISWVVISDAAHSAGIPPELAFGAMILVSLGLTTMVMPRLTHKEQVGGTA